MSTGQSAAPPPPFEVHSVHFDFPGGRAAHLRDPVSDQPEGASPEWVSGQSSRSVAFVRGSTPQVRVVFSGAASRDGDYLISADGLQCGVSQAKVSLTFDATSGLSSAVVLDFRGALPDAIGVHDLTLDWHAADPTAADSTWAVGSSSHEICTTWRPMQANGGQGLEEWVYSPIVRWTSKWAAGAGDERAICDAIIRNVSASNLRYGIPVHAVRDMLLRGGGMCGGWFHMFQQMAHSQGVFVHRRFFGVHWRPLPTGEERWCAIVIKSGGLNQSAPTQQVAQFQDHDGPLADVGTATLTLRSERRYRFWGLRGGWNDGHCINFLEHGGRIVLYDACFGIGPISTALVFWPSVN